MNRPRFLVVLARLDVTDWFLASSLPLILAGAWLLHGLGVALLTLGGVMLGIVVLRDVIPGMVRGIRG